MNNTIKNIIFDLGGVVIDIDMNITYLAFSKLLNISPEEVYNKFYETNLWNKHETGEISDTEIRNEIRNFNNTQLTDNQIDTAWNALLLDIPKIRIDRILELSKSYKTFVLSNTNGIHTRQFSNLLFKNTGIESLHSVFQKVYYSHEMGVRKPDINIYLELLNSSNILAEDTLFLDDNFENIQAAQSLGIKSLQVIKPLSMLDYLKNY